MPSVELLVLQPTPFCNIDCKYCYLPNRSSRAKMTFETIDRVFSGLFSSHWVGKKLDVLWHAGEPLVLGVDYYTEAFRVIRNVAPSDVQLQHYFQTNGMLINDRWCEFFKANHARVGVSIDGPQELHDSNRITRSGRPTFAQTLGGIRCLQRHDLAFSVISVLGTASLSKAQELHEFYQSEGIKNVCFNVEEIEGVNTTSSLSGPDTVVKFENFMREFWNLTVDAKGPYSVREFRQMLQNILTPEGRTVHNTLVTPLAILSVDHEGNFSTFSPELLGQKNEEYGDFIIGNFWKTKLEDSLESNVFKRLSHDVAAGVDLCRKSCQYFPVCGGGSPVNKLYENGTPISTETMYCRLHAQVIADVAVEIIENSASIDQSATTAGSDAERSDLYILGAGVSFPEHLTTQTLEVLRNCRRICTNLPEERLIALPPELRAKCISLWRLYQDKRRRVENYRDVTRAVIEAAESERPVAWLTPGHPRVFDSVSEALLEAGRTHGWKVSVLPAVSCLDTLLAELDYDPAGGLLIHDATSLVAQSVPLIPSVPTLLLQPGVFGSDRAHLSREFTGTDLTQLRDYLLQFYGPEHRCAFVRSAMERERQHRIWWVQLRDLATTPDAVIPGSTLFLSAVEWDHGGSPPRVRARTMHVDQDARSSRQMAPLTATTSDADSEITPEPKFYSDRIGRDPARHVSDSTRESESDSRLVLFLGPVNESLDRIEVGAKATPLPVGIGKLVYEKEAVVPDRRWRTLKAAEARLVVVDSPPRNVGDGIGIIRLSSDLLEPFHALQVAAGQARKEEELAQLVGSAACREGVRLVTEHVRRHFQCTLPDQDLSEEKIVGGIYVRPPGLPTVTVQPHTNRLIGLHVDNWYLFPITRRGLAPNRICINLGREDRFFLFVNVPVAQMKKAVARSGLNAEPDGTMIARKFIASFPQYPILRVRICPGEAYIAPTENVMHDASSFEMSTMDVTLSLRGRFDLRAH